MTKSLRDAIAKVHADVEAQNNLTPVKVLGLVIGMAKDWHYMEDNDDHEYYVLYEGFVPLKGSIPAGNILIDYENGNAYLYKDTDDGVDVDWQFPFDILAHIQAME